LIILDTKNKFAVHGAMFKINAAANINDYIMNPYNEEEWLIATDYNVTFVKIINDNGEYKFESI